MAFRENTTFVIGAGASAEFGLPVGSQLATRIKLTAGSIDPASGTGFFDYLIESNFDRDERMAAYKAMNAIRDGIHTAVSIDAFIHRMNSNKYIRILGKALIAYEILKAERESTLSESTSGLFNLLEKGIQVQAGANEAYHPDYTWITHFFKILADGIEQPSIVGNRISIICFNYDRCIEFFLANTLSAAYGLSLEDALQLVETRFHIIHPYGSLGRLAFHPNDDGIPFGHEASGDEIMGKVVDRIKTYTEQSHSVENIVAIHDAIAHAKNIVFLGFGFNNQNLDILRIKHRFKIDNRTRNIYATGLGLHEQIDDTLRRRINQLFTDSTLERSLETRIRVEYGANCTKLFHIHDMNLGSFTQRAIYVDLERNPPTSQVLDYREQRDYND